MIARHSVFHRERGAAAVEFALVLPVMILLLWGLVTFGGVFYTQMALTRAVSDGARAIGMFPPSTPLSEIQLRVREEVLHSLSTSQVTPPQYRTRVERYQWLDTQLVSTAFQVDNQACGTGAGGAGQVRVRLQFPYENVRLLPSISLPMIGSMDSWMPRTLTACAVAEV